MWRNFVILSIIIGVCYCGEDYPLKKPYYHHHHKDPYYLWYGGGLLYYLTFLLIKIKAIFVLGSIFTFILFAGKLWAIIRYIESTTKSINNSNQNEPQKIYIQAPNYKEFSPYSDIKEDWPSQTSSLNDYSNFPSPNYERNFQRDDKSIYENYSEFFKIIQKLNITDLALESMDLNTENCKKRFICKANLIAEDNILLGYGLKILKDDKYKDYETIQKNSSIEDCDNLYPNC